jgi:adenosylmethionine-8-amino-7-oxononanoate aminotransferase
MEAALKLARQYYVNRSQPQRTRFIARRNSFHGATLGALAVSGQHNRRSEFEPLLGVGVSFVSDCHPYRNQMQNESLEDFCARLVDELDKEFERMGGENVCAFVAETVSGSVSVEDVLLLPIIIATADTRASLLGVHHQYRGTSKRSRLFVKSTGLSSF